MVTAFAVAAALAYVLRPPGAVSPCAATPPGAVSPCAATPPALRARVATRARQLVCGVVSHDSDSSAHPCPQCGKAHASRNQLYAHLRASYATCGKASGLDLATRAPVRLRKSVLSFGYGPCGGGAAAELIRAELEALEGVPVHAMTRASDWRYRRSPLLRQPENIPAAADVLVYSTAAVMADEPEIPPEMPERPGVGEPVEGRVGAGGAGDRSLTRRLARLNAALAPHAVTVFDWQAALARRIPLRSSPAGLPCLLASLNSELSLSELWQGVVPNPTGQRLHAERDCTARTYECLLPLEYLLSDGGDTEPTLSDGSDNQTTIDSGGDDNQPTIGHLSGEEAGEEAGVEKAAAATQVADAANAD